MASTDLAEPFPPQARASTDLAEPFPPQAQAAKEVMDSFRSLRYVLFRAPLQSGKTGTYQSLARQMLSEKWVDWVYVVCGSHETELRQQVMADVVEWHGADALGTRVFVVFRQDMRRVEMRRRRVLIVVDESHMDCLKGQELEQFLGRHGLGLTGTTADMVRRHVYILSVSATPFAEEAVIAHGGGLPKAVVRLRVDSGYYGPLEYHREGLLRAAYSLEDEAGQARWVEEVLRVIAGGRYVLVRLRESRGKAVLTGLIEWLESEGVRVGRFTSKQVRGGQEVALTRVEADRIRGEWGVDVICLEEEPREAGAVIVLDGRLRCGKRLPKRWVGMTWDAVETSPTDVVLQGLVGRMCGWIGDRVDSVPRRQEDRAVLYTCPFLFERVTGATVPLSDLERFGAGSVGSAVEIVPRFGKHLRRGTVEREMRVDGEVVTQCVPVRFQVETEMKMGDFGGIRAACFAAFRGVVRDVVGDDFTEEQRVEILSRVSEMGADDCHVRQFGGSSQVGFYRALAEAWRGRVACRERVSDGWFLTFCVVFEGYTGLEVETDRAGTVYAVIFTKAAGLRRCVPLASRVPEENGETAFSLPEDAAATATVPTYGLSAGICESPSRFEEQLRALVSRVPCGQVIMGDGLRFSVDEYGEALEEVRAILRRLGSAHGVRFRRGATTRKVGAREAVMKWLAWGPLE